MDSNHYGRVKDLRRKIFLLTLLLLSFAAFPVRAGDVPTKNDSSYYEISTAAQLQWFASQVNGKNASINGVLTADIDLSSLEGDYWTPIGDGVDDADIVFKGVFDGNNHVVSGLTVRPSLGSGLFGYVNGATIRNLVISHPVLSQTSLEISRTNSFVGSLCGTAITLLFRTAM